jgi:hypothetical protein
MERDLYALPLLKLLVAGLSSRRPGFANLSIRVGFVVDKVALGQVFPRYSVFACQYIIAPTHLSPPHEVCNSSDQGAHYHTLGPLLGASSVTWHLAVTEER